MLTTESTAKTIYSILYAAARSLTMPLIVTVEGVENLVTVRPSIWMIVLDPTHQGRVRECVSHERFSSQMMR